MSGAVGTTGSDVRPDARPVFIRHAASALGLVCPESSVLVAIYEGNILSMFLDNASKG